MIPNRGSPKLINNSAKIKFQILSEVQNLNPLSIKKTAEFRPIIYQSAAKIKYIK